MAEGRGRPSLFTRWLRTTSWMARLLRRGAISVLAALLGLVVSQARGEENWPQFRGPTGLGYTSEKDLPVTWGGKDDENVLWKSPLTGQGHASPIVWGERVFVCTAHWPPEVQQREKVIPEHHVLCFDAHDSKLLWDTLVPPGPWLRSDFRSGPGGGYACPTPTTDGNHPSPAVAHGRLYLVGQKNVYCVGKKIGSQ